MGGGRKKISAQNYFFRISSERNLRCASLEIDGVLVVSEENVHLQRFWSRSLLASDFINQLEYTPAD